MADCAAWAAIAVAAADGFLDLADDLDLDLDLADEEGIIN